MTAQAELSGWASDLIFTALHAGMSGSSITEEMIQNCGRKSCEQPKPAWVDAKTDSTLKCEQNLVCWDRWQSCGLYVRLELCADRPPHLQLYRCEAVTSFLLHVFPSLAAPKHQWVSHKGPPDSLSPWFGSVLPSLHGHMWVSVDQTVVSCPDKQQLYFNVVSLQVRVRQVQIIFTKNKDSRVQHKIPAASEYICVMNVCKMTSGSVPPLTSSLNHIFRFVSF